MKRIARELEDLKAWAAYLSDILSLGKRDVAALKILLLLAIIVIPGGILLQSSPGVYQDIAVVLSPVSGFFQGFMPGPSQTTNPGTHTGVPGTNEIPPWPEESNVSVSSPSPSPVVSPASNNTSTQDMNQSPTSTPEPTATPAPVDTYYPTPVPTGSPTLTPVPTVAPVPTGTPIPSPTPTPVPAASFVGTPTTGDRALTVQFTDTSNDNGNAITTWLWDFGDGQTSDEQNPAHEYTTEGYYTVSLTVTNGGGSNTCTILNYITVTAPIPPAPVASFTGTPTTGEAALTVQFTDTSNDNGNAITTWLWDFGDGQTSDEQNPTHQYITEGLYTVTLRVTNGGGSNACTIINYITVTSLPSWEP